MGVDFQSHKRRKKILAEEGLCITRSVADTATGIILDDDLETHAMIRLDFAPKTHGSGICRVVTHVSKLHADQPSATHTWRPTIPIMVIGLMGLPLTDFAKIPPKQSRGVHDLLLVAGGHITYPRGPMP